MHIYEKIFSRLEELHMSQIELSRRTGIATSTISDWRKKKINPQAEKLVLICKALNMSLIDLLYDEQDHEESSFTEIGRDLNTDMLIEKIEKASSQVRKRLLIYMEQLDLPQNGNISIISDVDGNKIVVINDLRFKGRKTIDWSMVENCLKDYIGICTEIIDTSDLIYIGSDFPDEYTHSKDTKILRGANEYAKANASVAITDLIQVATNKSFSENYEKKHAKDAKYGWYRYDTRFAIPKYNNERELIGYNIFKARLVVRHSEDGKLYLYDILRIKKETSKPLE